jgi:nucleotide-binding universal stress UspA family protein
MKLVLVAIDESEAAKRVAEFVNDFFEPQHTQLVGVNVARVMQPWVPGAVAWGGVYPWPYPYAAPVSPASTSAEDVEAQASEAVLDAGLEDAPAVGAVGEPAETIVAVAEERGADLIVVGSNHRNALQRFLEPSVSRRVVKQSSIPVLVVP